MWLEAWLQAPILAVHVHCVQRCTKRSVHTFSDTAALTYTRPVHNSTLKRLLIGIGQLLQRIAAMREAGVSSETLPTSVAVMMAKSTAGHMSQPSATKAGPVTSARESFNLTRKRSS